MCKVVDMKAIVRRFGSLGAANVMSHRERAAVGRDGERGFTLSRCWS